MGYILTAEAAMRVAEAKEQDPLVRWLSEEQISPFIDWVTMAVLQFEIMIGKAPAQRAPLSKSYAVLAKRLKGNTGEQVIQIALDDNSANILSQLMVVASDNHSTLPSDTDLVPAAIAMANNLDLVVTEYIDEWEMLAREIRESSSGELHLKIIR